MKLSKKLLRWMWGVEQPTTQLADPLPCDGCRIARMNGGDACWEHHNAHPRAHTYKMGHEVDWGSGLDGRDVATPPRPSASSIG